MTDPIHPARTCSFDDLITGLDQACTERLVHRRVDPKSGLALFVYTNRCVYDGTWNFSARVARGLIVDPENRRIVATPFPKFFNLGEGHGEAPDLPFDVFEKLDGSLIITFHHDGRWRAATKGAFASDQAQWAQAKLDAADLSSLVPGTTYLFEAVYPENKIVVRYTEAAMVMLAAYDEAGRELTYEQLIEISAHLGWRAATRHRFTSIAEMVETATMLPRDEEGYVLRFIDGTRLKIKGGEYRRIHALISGCTPLAIWETINAGDDLDAIRRDLPEEFWTDFDDIRRLLSDRIATLERAVAELAASVAHLSDKEVGLTLDTMPPDSRQFLFPFRKFGGLNKRARAGLLRAVRPTNNEPPGYTPSFAMSRMIEDALSS